MLYSFDSGYIKDIPHRREFDIFRSKLTDEQYQAIFDELNSRVETDEIDTSSWMPGADRTGTVFQPIYDVACRNDFDASAKFFGLILWHVMLERKEVWAFGRYEKGGVPIERMTYFRITKP